MRMRFALGNIAPGFFRVIRNLSRKPGACVEWPTRKANPARRAEGDRRSMARKKSLKIWQIWHVEFARPRSRRTDGDHRCYQIIARLVRGEKNYWVGVDTTADPPMWASFRSEEHTSELQSRLHLV